MPEVIVPSTSYVRDVQEGVVRRAPAALGLDYIMPRCQMRPGEARERQRISKCAVYSLASPGHRSKKRRTMM